MSKSLILSNEAGSPLYQQLKNAIIHKVKSGEWQAGYCIPSENQLSRNLKMSRMTVNRALRELVTEGVIVRRHGSGSFIAETPQRVHLLELKSIADDIQAKGRTHRAEILALQETQCDAALANEMQLKVDDPVFYVSAVHFQDEQPIQLEDRFVNPALVPDFLSVDFDQVTPTDYLIQTLQADELEHVIEATHPTQNEAEWLAISSNEPCLKLRRRTWYHQQVVTRVDLLYPSSRYQLGARFSPVNPSQSLSTRASS